VDGRVLMCVADREGERRVVFRPLKDGILEGTNIETCRCLGGHLALTIRPLALPTSILLPYDMYMEG